MSQSERAPTFRPPTAQASHDAEAFDDYRSGLDRASGQPVPRMSLALLAGTVVVLAIAIALTFATWIEYQREDGSVGTANGIWGDGFVLIATSLLAITMLIVASLQQPGHGDFQAMIAFGATIVGAIAVLFTLMAPEFITINEPETPVSYARAWGLYGASLSAVLGAYGTYRLWKVTDHF